MRVIIYIGNNRICILHQLKTCSSKQFDRVYTQTRSNRGNLNNLLQHVLSRENNSYIYIYMLVHCSSVVSRGDAMSLFSHPASATVFISLTRVELKKQRYFASTISENCEQRSVTESLLTSLFQLILTKHCYILKPISLA